MAEDHSTQTNLPSVTNVEIFSSLEKTDLPSGTKHMNPSQRKSWLPEFSKNHLPSNRLKTHDDDMTGRFQSVDRSRQRRKKTPKVKVSRSIHAKLKTRRKESQTAPSTSTTQSYSTYVPLRHLWVSYVEDLLQLDGTELRDSVLPTLAQKLMKADLNGCPLSVRRSRCPSYVGVEGIVIQETRNMFTLISPDDKVRRIPKANSVFTVILRGVVFTIHGNQFLVRPGERAAKKFKAKPTIDF